MEFSRSGLLARFFVISVVATLLPASGADALAGSEGRPGAILVAAVSGPAAGDAAERQTARYFTINQVLAQLDRTVSSNNSRSQSASDVTATTNRAQSDSDEPFGFSTFRAPEGLLWAKWRKLEVDLDDEERALARCRADPVNCPYPAAKQYLALIVESRQLSGRSRIALINRAINRAIRYTSDQDQFGVPDVWTAPIATLGNGRGDCEDYAIAKYVALRDAGYAAKDLRLLIVRDRNARQDHAVAAVREGGRWLMLDNRHDILLEQKDARHFTPLFALDDQGVKLFAMPYEKPATAAHTAAGRAESVEPASTEDNDVPGAESLGLRLDTFEPPQLRGRL